VAATNPNTGQGAAKADGYILLLCPTAGSQTFLKLLFQTTAAAIVNTALLKIIPIFKDAVSIAMSLLTRF
jgi:hypothetical protein